MTVTVTDEHQKIAAQIVEACGHTTRRTTWEDAIALTLAEAAASQQKVLDSSAHALNEASDRIAQLEAELKKETARRQALIDEQAEEDKRTAGYMSELEGKLKAADGVLQHAKQELERVALEKDQAYQRGFSKGYAEADKEWRTSSGGHTEYSA